MVAAVRETREIKAVSDFFAVPVEKRAHCLKDFELWLEMASAMKAMFGDVKGVHVPTDIFIWVDDGKHDANIKISIVSSTS